MKEKLRLAFSSELMDTPPLDIVVDEYSVNPIKRRGDGFSNGANTQRCCSDHRNGAMLPLKMSLVLWWFSLIARSTPLCSPSINCVPLSELSRLQSLSDPLLALREPSHVSSPFFFAASPLVGAQQRRFASKLEKNCVEKVTEGSPIGSNLTLIGIQCCCANSLICREALWEVNISRERCIWAQLL